jgi:hypothetical protein
MNNSPNDRLEGKSLVEALLKGAIQAYQQAWNQHNNDKQIRYQMTLTRHKVPTEDGNKSVAYLRLERVIITPSKLEGEEPVEVSSLVHQEIHVFSSKQQELNPDSRWEEELYLRCLTRILGAGLEYAELLQKLKGQKPQGSEGIVKTATMPAPLTDDEKKYQEWVKKNSEYGNKS